MEVKTFRPTASEFAVGLAAYVANVVQKDLHTLNCGLAKVIPPDTFWLNASEAETKCLEQATTNNIIVKPIKPEKVRKNTMITQLSIQKNSTCMMPRV